MNHWLLKSEPDAYSWDELVRQKRGVWDGVRNFQARNNLRAMKVGDLALFYHSVSERRVVGVARVVREAYPDPTAKEGDWSVVEVVPHQALAFPVTLDVIKADPLLGEMAIVRQSRLSVAPVTKPQFDRILSLGKKAR
ncbi:MAG: EVE domain-containing protein [bacterium]